MQKFLCSLLVDFMSWLEDLASHQVIKEFLPKLSSSVFIDWLFKTFKYLDPLELILRVWHNYKSNFIYFFRWLATRLFYLLTILPLNDNFRLFLDFFILIYWPIYELVPHDFNCRTKASDMRFYYLIRPIPPSLPFFFRISLSFLFIFPNEYSMFF